MAEERRSNQSFLGARSQAGMPSRAGFSREAATPSPSLAQGYEQSTDTLGPALEQAGNIGAETYTSARANQIESQAEKVAEVAALDNSGELTPQEMEELENTNQVFQRYRRARNQGAMSKAAADIAIESEIKRVSSQFPGLGDQVRRKASQVLGFDPTGSEYAFLTQPPRQESQTELGKKRQEARQAAISLGKDPELFDRMVLKQYEMGLVNSVRDAQAERHSASAREISASFHGQATASTTQLANSLIRRSANGDYPSEEELGQIQAVAKANLRQQAERMRQRMSQVPGNSVADINSAVNNFIERQTEAIDGLGYQTDVGSVEDQNRLYEAKTQAIANQTLPLFRYAEAAGIDGPEMLNFVELMEDPDSFVSKQLASVNPKFEAAVEDRNLPNTIGQITSAIYANDRQALDDMPGNATRSVQVVAQDALNNSQVSRTNNREGEPVGANALRMLADMDKADFALEDIADNPSQFVDNPSVTTWYQRDLISDVGISRVASEIREKAGPDAQFIIDGDSVALENATSNLTPSDVPGSSLGALPELIVNYAYTQMFGDSRAQNVISVSKALSNDEFAASVGMSREQYIEKLNAGIQRAETQAEAGGRRRREARATLDTAQPVTTQQVTEAAEQAGIDPQIYNNLIKQESNMGRNLISGAGAVGVAQFMPATAEEMGLRVPERLVELDRQRISASGEERQQIMAEMRRVSEEQNYTAEEDERLNASKSLAAGARYLAQNARRFNGDMNLAVMAYNAGAGRVNSVLNDEGGSLPSETNNYSRKILGFDGNTYISSLRDATSRAQTAGM